MATGTVDVVVDGSVSELQLTRKALIGNFQYMFLIISDAFLNDLIAHYWLLPLEEDQDGGSQYLNIVVVFNFLFLVTLFWIFFLHSNH